MNTFTTHPGSPCVVRFRAAGAADDDDDSPTTRLGAKVDGLNVVKTVLEGGGSAH